MRRSPNPSACSSLSSCLAGAPRSREKDRMGGPRPLLPALSQCGHVPENDSARSTLHPVALANAAVLGCAVTYTHRARADEC